jgi:hypothetical protein
MPSTLIRESLRHELEERDDICVVAEVSTPLELLRRTEVEQADAVVLETTGEAEIPGVLSHLFTEFPQMIAVVTDRTTSRAVVYRQKIHEQVYEGVSLAAVLAELRTAETGYWVPAQSSKGNEL